jgi:hypothetical protein
MIAALVWLLSCTCGGLDAAAIDAALGEGAQIQIAKADLTKVVGSATVAAGRLHFSAPLRPLRSVVLIISQPPAKVVTIDGFVGASGRDIMVQQQRCTVSLRALLEQNRQITLSGASNGPGSFFPRLFQARG